MAQITLTEREYEDMKSKITSLTEELKICKSELKEAEPSVLKRRLKENAFKLANLYLKTIFKKLGFDVREGCHSRYYDTLQFDHCDYIPESWHLDDKSIKVKIEAQITTEMREAFIRIGIITTEAKDEDPLEIHETSIHN